MTTLPSVAAHLAAPADLPALLAASSLRQPLVASNCWASITEQVAELQALSETRVPFGLRTKLQHLLATLDPNQKISVGFAHGDFTPWNCWLGPEKLAIYNLELALPEASLLYDLFHFEVQQALLTTRRSAVDIRTQALATAQEHFAAVPAAELVVAWQLYLLHQVATGALLYHAQTTWHPQVTELMNDWNALLTLELAPAMEHRQLAVFDLLDYVQLLTQPGVVLKPRAANAYYSAPTSDLDLLLNEADVLAGVHFLRYFPLTQSAVLRSAAHMQSVDCLFQDGSLLSVDLLHQLEHMDLRLLDAEALLTQAKRAAAGFSRPSGLVITFSGVDGAGKSTLIEPVNERLEKKWRKRVVVIRHRPSVLPIISAWKYGKQSAKARRTKALTRRWPASPTMSIMFLVRQLSS